MNTTLRRPSRLRVNMEVDVDAPLPLLPTCAGMGLPWPRGENLPPLRMTGEAHDEKPVKAKRKQQASRPLPAAERSLESLLDLYAAQVWVMGITDKWAHPRAWAKAERLSQEARQEIEQRFAQAGR